MWGEQNECGKPVAQVGGEAVAHWPALAGEDGRYRLGDQRGRGAFLVKGVSATCCNARCFVDDRAYRRKCKLLGWKIKNCSFATYFVR